jgi:hypothetical protein
VRLACVRPPSVESCFEASSSPQTGFGSFAEFPFPRRRTNDPSVPSSRSRTTHVAARGTGDSSGLPVSVRPFPEIPSRLAVRTDFPMSKYCSHGILLRFSLLCVDVSRSHVNETASSLLPTESSLLPPRSALGLSIARRLAPSGFCSSPTPSYAPSNDTVDVLDHRRRRTIGRLLQHRG